jgi:thiol-disulfide isomerase/thioredoxin
MCIMSNVRFQSWRVFLVYPLVALIAFFFAIKLFQPPRTGGARPGQMAPPISAPDWLNGEPPDIAGKVVVLDAWFAACPPCLKKAPELVRAHERFRDRGVVFIGLTPDGEEELPESRAFLQRTGITWPNGYGAIETLQAFLTDGGYFPSLWVIGRDRKVTWNRDSPGTLDEAIEKALK